MSIVTCVRTPEMIEKMMKKMSKLRANGLTWAKVAAQLNRTSIPGPRWEKWTGDRAMKVFFIYKKTVPKTVEQVLTPREVTKKDSAPKKRGRSAAAKRAWKTRRKSEEAVVNHKKTAPRVPFSPDVNDYALEDEDPPRRPRGRPPGSKTMVVRPTLQISYSEAAGRVQISLAYDGPHRPGLAEIFAARARTLLS